MIADLGGGGVWRDVGRCSGVRCLGGGTNHSAGMHPGSSSSKVPGCAGASAWLPCGPVILHL